MRINQYYPNETYLFLPYSEEDPALLFSPFVSLCDGIPGELALLVEYLGEVLKDSGGFENRCGVMSDSGNTSVRVDLEEPRRLDLVVNFSDVGIADAHLDKTGNTRLVRSASVEKQHCKRYILVVRGIAVCSLRRIIRKLCFVG